MRAFNSDKTSRNTLSRARKQILLSPILWHYHAFEPYMAATPAPIARHAKAKFVDCICNKMTGLRQESISCKIPLPLTSKNWSLIMSFASLLLRLFLSKQRKQCIMNTMSQSYRKTYHPGDPTKMSQIDPELLSDPQNLRPAWQHLDKFPEKIHWMDHLHAVLTS